MQEGDNLVYIAKVSGSAYDMGYALAQLYGDLIAENMNGFYEYVYESVVMFVYDEFKLPDIILKIMMMKPDFFAGLILDILYIV